MPNVSFNAGRMRHPVKILHQTAVSDVSGTSTVWTVFASAYASIDPGKSPGEILGKGQSVADLYLDVSIRFQPGITEAMRVQALNGTYKILAIKNVLERNAILTLVCEAIGLNE